MANSTPNYYSYLLRIWHEKEREVNLRAMLENVHTGEKRYFANLESAFRFLQEQVHENQESAEE
jgi:hypothetical protein